MTALTKLKKTQAPASIKRSESKYNVYKTTLSDNEKTRIDLIQKKYKHILDALPLD